MVVYLHSAGARGSRDHRLQRWCQQQCGVGTQSLTLTDKAGSTVRIIEAKHYAHASQAQCNSHTLHSNNLYRVFTYQIGINLPTKAYLALLNS